MSPYDVLTGRCTRPPNPRVPAVPRLTTPQSGLLLADTLEQAGLVRPLLLRRPPRAGTTS
jgi:hypothetical protein